MDFSYCHITGENLTDEELQEMVDEADRDGSLLACLSNLSSPLDHRPPPPPPPSFSIFHVHYPYMYDMYDSFSVTPTDHLRWL